MKQISTQSIILARTDFGEADRILTVLTPDQGKLRLMAKGVRRVKSKLAGGIELFSVSDITFAPGRGEIGTLVSSRLNTHYSKIAADFERTMLGYDLIKRLHKNTEDQPETEYFILLNNGFAALNDAAINAEAVKIWFGMQLLQLAGHAPNLQTDTRGETLESSRNYSFSIDDMAFAPAESGKFSSHHIKILRLAVSQPNPYILAHIQGGADFIRQLLPLLDTMSQTHLRV